MSMDAAPLPSAQTSPPPTPLLWRWGLWLEGFIERMFIMFCVYTLSIGPMYWSWVDAKFAHGPKILAAFYEPLRMLGEAYPLFGKCLNWYVSFWV
ncbi:hypothetical protein SH661x_000195 [Planctomicrobium sp. SH661]|uniref:hypothetical protein n=1 Tax=Planctomicrobium sp. SH661 TaxID=3448124 RepID=UPI003F5B4B8D